MNDHDAFPPIDEHKFPPPDDQRHHFHLHLPMALIRRIRARAAKAASRVLSDWLRFIANREAGK